MGAEFASPQVKLSQGPHLVDVRRIFQGPGHGRVQFLLVVLDVWPEAGTRPMRPPVHLPRTSLSELNVILHQL